MVQDQFSRPLFCYGSTILGLPGFCLCGTETLSVWNRDSVSVWNGDTVSVWIRDNVSVEQTQCLCGTHTVSLCGTRTVPGGGWAGGSRGLQPHTGASQSPPHTHPKLLSRSCGGIIGETPWGPHRVLWGSHGAQGPPAGRGPRAPGARGAIYSASIFCVK